ncbi:MAG: NUDIX domain-containing protein [Patescibacteria group bacterium]|jgi:8-oxo-dGTP diphosphatase
MPAPTDPKKAHFMFMDDMKFLQKAILYHPTENKFLILKRRPEELHRPNTWDLPGGNITYPEEHTDGILREIKEETGLAVTDLRPIQVRTNYNNEEKIYYLFIGHIGKSASGVVALSEEHTEYKWVTKEEFLKLGSADFLIDLVSQSPSSQPFEYR